MMPNREISSRIEEFISSWQVGDGDEDSVSVSGSSCGVSSTSAEITSRDQLECGHLFQNEHSALMPCFTSVDPTPYMDICSHNLRLLSNLPSKQSGLCDAAAAYIETCRIQGIELWMPTDCVSCKGGAESQSILRGGESLSYHNTAPRSADVVFLSLIHI